MWNLDLPKVAKLLGMPLPLASAAVESGTCRGASARTLAKNFAHVITMELSPDLHQETSAKLAEEGLAQIQCLQGNSAALLPGVLKGLAGEPTLFIFLDAHWSGDQSVVWQEARWKGYGFDTAHLGAGARPSSAEQCPLQEEFRAIVDHYPGRAFVLVDDAKNLPESGAGLRDLEFPGEDWSHLSRSLLRAELGDRLAREFSLENPRQWLLEISPSKN